MIFIAIFGDRTQYPRRAIGLAPGIDCGAHQWPIAGNYSQALRRAGLATLAANLFRPCREISSTQFLNNCSGEEKLKADLGS